MILDDTIMYFHHAWVPYEARCFAISCCNPLILSCLFMVSLEILFSLKNEKYFVMILAKYR